MCQRHCAVWLTLLTCGLYLHSANGFQQMEQNTACSAFGACSQVCTTNADKVNCTCADGFKLKDNRWGCDPLDASWKLIYSTSRYDWWVLSMWRSEIKNKTRVAFPNGFRPYGISYNARNNDIYTTGPNSGRFSVFRTSLQNGSSVELFPGMVLSHNLAFDWTTGNIYFTDAITFRIFVCKNNSNACAVLIHESFNRPEHIALHPPSGLLFWTEKGATSGIKRAGMDGIQPLKIVSFESPMPIGLTVDQANERIYFAVENNGRNRYAIQSSRFDGSDQKTAISGQIAGKPSGLNVLGDRIIWYDSSSKSIQSAEKFNGSKKEVYMRNVDNNYGLVVFHVANQPVSGTSQCVEADFSHICTISPQESCKCFCPAEMKLAADNTICTETDDAAKLIVASEGTFRTMIFGSIEKEMWKITQLEPNITSINGIVYNPVNHTLILSDSRTKRIYEYSLTSKKLSVLVERHLDMVQSLDIDVVGENLYWADSGKNTIEVMSLRTSARGLIMRNLTNIRDIVVVPEISSLYVLTRDEEKGKVLKMLPGGGNASVLQYMINPVALSYHRRLGRIFWVERTSTILEIKFSVEERSSRWTHSSYGESTTPRLPYAMVTFGDLVYNAYNSYIKVVGSGEKFVGSCRCPDGMILGEDKKTCKSVSTCPQNEFACSSTNKCIPKNYICDGWSDCENGEDERNCQKNTCTPAYFKCATSGKCIPGDWVCDEEHDCVGGDDEFNCTRSCNAGAEFTCESTKQCIPISSRCDGFKDCLEDNSDEKDCKATSCAENQLLCRSGHCIEKELLCNGIANCDDAEDENNCTGVGKEATGNGITTCAVGNNNETTYVVVIVVLLTLIVIKPLGVIIVRWSVHKFFQPSRPVVKKRITDGVEVVVDETTELTSGQNVDRVCMETGLSSNKITKDSNLDVSCPMENILSDSRGFEGENIAVAVDTEDRGHHFVSFSDMEKLIPSTAATNNEVDTRPVLHNN